MTTIINLYGGPGTGKSTTAAGLFHKMKSEGYQCELVQEYAKDLTYGEDFKKLRDQFYISAKQNHRIWKLQGMVDYIITDSPLLMSTAYTDDNELKDFVYYTFSKYQNINIFLQRTDHHPYQEYGRSQTLDEAISKDIEIKKILVDRGVDFTEIGVSLISVEDILKLIKEIK